MKNLGNIGSRVFLEKLQLKFTYKTTQAGVIWVFKTAYALAQFLAICWMHLYDLLL